MFLGHPVAVLFFLGLTFAGFSSLIAQLELPTRVFIDAGFNRSRAIGLVVGCSFLLGIPSAINIHILSNQDFVWGVALMISGGFMAFSVIRYGVRKIRTTDLVDHSDWRLGIWWEKIVQFFIPVAAVVLLIWWLSLSALVFAPDQWYNPFNGSSVATVLVQWILVMGILLILNRWIASRTRTYDLTIDG